MNEIDTTILKCFDRVREILTMARSYALQTVNASMISAYFEIGYEIV